MARATSPTRIAHLLKGATPRASEAVVRAVAAPPRAALVMSLPPTGSHEACDTWKRVNGAGGEGVEEEARRKRRGGGHGHADSRGAEILAPHVCMQETRWTEMTERTGRARGRSMGDDGRTDGKKRGGVCN